MSLLKEEIYKEVKNQIIKCQLAPGQFIRESDIEKELDVSRTPLREAFSKLEQEGLLQVIPKKGVQVKNLSLTTINYTYETRRLLGPFILENYWDNLDLQQFDQIAKNTKQLQSKVNKNEKDLPQIQKFFKLDNQFHTLIIKACNNIFLKDALTRAEDEVRRTRMLIGKDSRFLKSSNEHLQIIVAILKNDKQEAIEALIQHLNNSKDIALKSMSTRNINYR